MSVALVERRGVGGRGPVARERLVEAVLADGAARSGGRTVALMIESDGPGGAEIMLLNLAEGLRARGHRVLPILPRDGCGWLGRRLEERGFWSEHFLIRRFLDGKCVTALARLLRRANVSVVHAHEFALAVYGAGAARIAGIPTVITMHGGDYHENLMRRRLALRWAAGRSRAFVAVSEASASRLSRSLWFPPKRIRVIPNGVPTREGRGEGIRLSLGVPSDERLIVAVGNLYPVKGHRVLVRALGQLHVSRPDLRWQAAIAGRGEEEIPLRRLVGELGLEELVHVLGFRDDVPDLLHASDVFVLPSHSEGLPLALLEAMLAGKPAVASRVGGVGEVLQDGVTGLMVPPGEPQALCAALERLLDDPGLQMKLGAQAREHALRRYTVDTMVDAYEKAYGFGPRRRGGHGAW